MDGSHSSASETTLLERLDHTTLNLFGFLKQTTCQLKSDTCFPTINTEKKSIHRPLTNQPAIAKTYANLTCDILRILQNKQNPYKRTI